jgi:hypothetical protein
MNENDIQSERNIREFMQLGKWERERRKQAAETLFCAMQAARREVRRFRSNSAFRVPRSTFT